MTTYNDFMNKYTSGVKLKGIFSTMFEAGNKPRDLFLLQNAKGNYFSIKAKKLLKTCLLG
jgi:hypothetical protein